MAELTADFEAGTNGNTITTGAGEASATAWNSVTVDSPLPRYSNTHVAHGTLAAEFGRPSGSNYCLWSISDTESYLRFYIYFPSALSGNLNFVYWDIGVYPCGLSLNEAGTAKLKIKDTGSAHSATTSAGLSVGTWYRVEMHVVHSATVGSMTLRYYLGDSSSLIEEISFSNGNTGASVSEIAFGTIAGSALAESYWLDDIVANATDWPGPAASALAVQTFKRFYGPAQLGSSAADLYTVPASTVARVMGIHASNPSGSPVDLTLSIGADGAATRVYDGYALGADGVLDDHSPYELAAGEKIQGFASSAATVNLTITGWEKPA